MQKITAYIEIEKNSNVKYEYDKKFNKLIIDRILPEPYYYPFAYGFIPNTIGKDNDELDILVITKKHFIIDTYIDGYIIGGFEMKDEKGIDEKIFIVPCDEYELCDDINKMNNNDLENIKWFFSNYKSKCNDKWSKVTGLLDKNTAINFIS